MWTAQHPLKNFLILQGNKTQYSLLLNDRGLYEAHTLEDVQGFAQEFINHQALLESDEFSAS